MFFSKKGITPIISVILLLMMSVAVAGLAWFWLQSLAGTTMNATDTMTKQQTNQMLSLIDVPEYNTECIGTTVTNVSVLVFNRGSTTLNLNTLLVNGKKATINAPVIQIPPGAMKDIKAVDVGGDVLPNFKVYQTRNVEFTVSGNEGYVKKTMSLSGSRCSAAEKTSLSYNGRTCSGNNVNTIRFTVDNTANGVAVAVNTVDIDGKTVVAADVVGGLPFNVLANGFTTSAISNIQTTYKPGFQGGNTVIAAGNTTTNWYASSTLNVQNCP